ncbi:acyltransferase [Paractinoplanes ferrugineus]|uniref:Acyltransferase n=1 Tax=Paractinoplanes ferrugineus TaxID=113564 RepID=A0A919IYL4_9ACTN|nr:acyltransferase [Actinoplanes ferrugineus]GIE10613.1 acyltransferase [Actinoplanes ferrugineus]
MSGTTTFGPHERRPELKALTGLRAVAAIAVVVSHVGVPKSLPHPLAQIAHWGYIGVPLFFMLSGVVLGYNYPQLTYKQHRRTIKFYIARIARVMPLYWVMVIYSALLYVSVDHQQYPKVFLMNIFGVQTWSGDLLAAQSRYNGPGWSIGAELFFYFLFPFVVPLVAGAAKRWGAKALLLIAGGMALVSLILFAYFVISGRADLPAADPGSAHRWLYRNPLCQLPIFLVGVAISFLLPYARQWSDLTHHVIQTLVLAYVLVLAMVRGEGGFWGAGSFGPFFVIPFAVALMSLASDRGWFARILRTRPMVTLGVASYALYITHRWFVWQLSTSDPVTKGHDIAPYVGFVVTICVLLLIGEGAHRYVEEPARRWIVNMTNRWARKFPARRRIPAQPAAPVQERDSVSV